MAESMPIARRHQIRSLSATAILLAISTIGMALPPEAGVSHALAIARSSRLSDLHYQLSFTLREHESAVAGTEILTFRSSSAGDLPLDYRDGVLRSATLNGHAIPLRLENGHLILPAVAGRNTVTLAFTSNAAPAGKSITRYEDKDDGQEYVYTLFVPMDASTAFPCFDQPDLKAGFTLDIDHPATWSVISNTAPASTGGMHSSFPETRPISTYLFAFAAGPFAALPPQHSGEPAVYVRKSQLERARAEVPQVQSIAARGIDYLSAYFAQPFPFPKYDLVLIPGFPFGGMEHAGATFLNEDGVLFRSTPTPSDYFRRNILVLHETCHQWFGDLVTMRWFDDLWLKEGFAQYMAYKALAELEPATNPWKHFYEDIKPLAYGIDETEGTTPIFQVIDNLKDAKSAYGAIVYQKAPAVLKQLEFHIGPKAFRNGLRSYLAHHAYGNAQWSDLIAAFKAAGTSAPSRPVRNANPNLSNLDAWADAWIRHRGMPEVDAQWSCTAGRIDRLTLTQHNVLPERRLWPISNQVSLNYLGQPKRPDLPLRLLLRVDWRAPSVTVSQASGKPCPTFIATDAGDEAYGRFLLDNTSETAVARLIVHASPDELGPLSRSMLWGALWDNVHVARSPPRDYLDLALQSLPLEADESLARVQGARVGTALHAYLSAAARKQQVAKAESVVAGRMVDAPSLALRIVNFRTFTTIAETPPALRQLKSLLSGSLAVEGLTLKPLDRWTLLGRLLALDDPEAEALYTAEQARDHSGEGQKYAYAVAAARPSAGTKQRYFEDYLHSTTVQEDWITQSLRPFNSWNQGALTAPYLKRALDGLSAIKQHRKIFFLGAWLNAFIEGQNTIANSPAAQATIRDWLSTEHVDPDLRLKILEAADTLNRTVLIRKAFPTD